MGDKIEAKRIAKDLGLPTIEGSEKGISKIEDAIEISNKIGYPVLIKAAGGGGGKGMRIVDKNQTFSKIYKWLKMKQKIFW